MLARVCARRSVETSTCQWSQFSYHRVEDDKGTERSLNLPKSTQVAQLALNSASEGHYLISPSSLDFLAPDLC